MCQRLAVHRAGDFPECGTSWEGSTVNCHRSQFFPYLKHPVMPANAQAMVILDNHIRKDVFL